MRNFFQRAVWGVLFATVASSGYAQLQPSNVAAPTNVRVIAGVSTLTVSWDSVASFPNEIVAGYTAFADPTGPYIATYPRSFCKTASQNTTTCTITPYDYGGVPYAVTVRPIVVDSNGNPYSYLPSSSTVHAELLKPSPVPALSPFSIFLLAAGLLLMFQFFKRSRKI